MNIYHKWEQITSNYGLHEEDAETQLRLLISLYNSPSRHYHNQEHIDMLIKELSSHPQSLQFSNEMWLALIYHDSVYEAKRDDNEKASASLFVQMWEEYMDSNSLQNVAKMILYTQNHFNRPKALSLEVNCLLDADLSILGFDEQVYDLYVLNLRKEYNYLKDSEFMQGRKKFLEKIIHSGENIYRDDWFNYKYEKQAQANIQREIENLELQK